MNIPQRLQELLRAEGIDAAEVYVSPAHRHIWCPDEEALRAALPAAKAVPWAPCFYAVPAATPLASLELVRQGRALGVEPASSLVVDALQLSADSHVLDLCCAPGTKLVLMAQRMSLAMAVRAECDTEADAPLVHSIDANVTISGSLDDNDSQASPRKRARVVMKPDRFAQSADDPTGTITAVDVSRTRIGAAISLVKRYRVGRLRVFCCSGTTFDVPPQVPITRRKNPSGAIAGFYLVSDTDYLPKNKAVLPMPDQRDTGAGCRLQPLYTSTVYRRMALQSLQHYDAVLVDAQCTHDGSVKHVLKHLDQPASFWDELLSPQALRETEDLQRALLRNALHLVRPGGLVVYCTCSLLRRQNEAIVAHALACDPYLRILDPVGPRNWIVDVAADSGEVLGQAIRVPPGAETGGSLFICRVLKPAL